MNEKKLLLVKPPYWHMPLGLAYVMRSLEKNNIPFDFVDTAAYPVNLEKTVRKGNYFAIATGGLSADHNFFRKFIKIVRETKPNLPIILGGNVTKDTNPDILFDKSMLGIDYGIIGEAETALPSFISKLKEGSNDLFSVPGLVYKDNSTGKIVKNNPVRFNLEDVNTLPAWEYINIDIYKKAWIPFLGIHSVMPVVSGRGCVGTCSFCSPTVGAFRKRPLEHVIEEIELLFSKYEFDLLNFLNEMFYTRKEDIITFCDDYKKLKSRKPWICALRADADVDVDTFKAMKDAGCVATSAGIESGSEKVLLAMKKRTTPERIRTFYRGTKEAKLPCYGTFMVGNESETEEDLKKTVDLVISEDLDTDAMLTDAYPGTLIYKNAIKRGLIKDEWTHLNTVSFITSLYDLNTKKNYVNISDIPQDRFWNVIYTQMRRFNTHFYNRYKAKDVRFDFSRSRETVKVSGACPTCGCRVEKTDSFNILSQRWFCPECFTWVSFDLYTTPGMSEHRNMLSAELQRSKKLVLNGTGFQSMNLIKYDHFGLPYDAIAGFIDTNPLKDGYPLFTDRKRLTIKELKNVLPDTILITDDPAGNSELMLRLFYLRSGIPLPTILHVLPDNMRPWGKIMRAISRQNNFVATVLFSVAIPALDKLHVTKTTGKELNAAAKKQIKKMIITFFGESTFRKMLRRVRKA